VHIIVAFPAGNASDIVARLTGQSLSGRLGQPFIIENRPGAGGTVGTEVVMRAAPDGYTLLMEVVPSSAINAALYPNLKYNFVRDSAPIASIGVAAYIMVVNPAVPATTVPEFIAYAKANPGKINIASTGNGTPTHVFGELFKMMAAIDLLHVPYRGSFMPDLLAGQVQIVFGPPSQLLEYIRASKLRALGVTSVTRQPALPDVAAIAEFVPGYEASVCYSIVAPKDTPAAIIEKLNNEINAGLGDPKMKTQLLDLGATPLVGSPGDLGKRIADAAEKWAKVIKSAGIRPN
jgi:tripartite-type tricarboxylate transporter receptor subunit TctC